MSENKKIASILKDALVLCLITLVAAVLLGFVNDDQRSDCTAEDREKGGSIPRGISGSSVNCNGGCRYGRKSLIVRRTLGGKRI